jgi:hypothetical protein
MIIMDMICDMSCVDGEPPTDQEDAFKCKYICTYKPVILA